MKKVLSNYRKYNRKIKKVNSKMNKTAKMFKKTTSSLNHSINSTSRRKRIMNDIGKAHIDNMDGEQFEYYLSKLFRKLGYKVQMTGHSGDFGTDLILRSNDGSRTIVQAKRYSNKVGIRAVQEIASAKKYYKAERTVVVTSNYFTVPAEKLAKTNDVILINREGLKKLVSKANQITRGIITTTKEEHYF